MFGKHQHCIKSLGSLQIWVLNPILTRSVVFSGMLLALGSIYSWPSFPVATDTSLKLEYSFQLCSATQTTEWQNSIYISTERTWIFFPFPRKRQCVNSLWQLRVNLRRAENYSPGTWLIFLLAEKAGCWNDKAGGGERSSETPGLHQWIQISNSGLCCGRMGTFCPFSPDHSLTWWRSLLSGPHCTNCSPPRVLGNACLSPGANPPGLHFPHTLDAATWSNPCSLQVKGFF